MCYPVTRYQVNVSQIAYNIDNFTTSDNGYVVLPEITDLMQDGMYRILIIPVNVIGVGEGITSTYCEYTHSCVHAF